MDMHFSPIRFYFLVLLLWAAILILRATTNIHVSKVLKLMLFISIRYSQEWNFLVEWYLCIQTLTKAKILQIFTSNEWEYLVIMSQPAAYVKTLFNFCQSNGWKVIIATILTYISLKSSESEHFMILYNTGSQIQRDFYKGVLMYLPRLDKSEKKRNLIDLPCSYSFSLANLN